MDHRKHMAHAIDLSARSVADGGGPFGAVIVRDGKIIGTGVNRVIPSADPTAHAEIVAIRAACEHMQTHDLSGAIVYTSSEPCPMCLAALWWARCSEVYFCNTRFDAAAIGFDDAAIYEEVCAALENRQLPIHRLIMEEALRVFRSWENSPKKQRY